MKIIVGSMYNTDFFIINYVVSAWRCMNPVWTQNYRLNESSIFQKFFEDFIAYNNINIRTYNDYYTHGSFQIELDDKLYTMLQIKYSHYCSSTTDVIDFTPFEFMKKYENISSNGT